MLLTLLCLSVSRRHDNPPTLKEGPVRSTLKEGQEDACMEVVSNSVCVRAKSGIPNQAPLHFI